MVSKTNANSIGAREIAGGVTRQRLFPNLAGQDEGISIDRITMAGNASHRIELTVASLGWLCVLDGEVTLNGLTLTCDMAQGSCALLPPGFKVELTAPASCVCLFVQVLDGGRFDPDFAESTQAFAAIDWNFVPILEAKMDGRKRIPLAGPDLDTSVFAIDLVVHPPGGSTPRYHHQDAATLLYFLGGHGRGQWTEQALSIQSGDLIYFPAGAWCSLAAAGTDELRFLEICLPGKFRTVWAKPAEMTSWMKTNFDIHGRRAAPE